MQNPFNRFTDYERMCIKHHFKMIFVARKLLKDFPNDDVLQITISGNLKQAKKIVKEANNGAN